MARSTTRVLVTGSIVLTSLAAAGAGLWLAGTGGPGEGAPVPTTQEPPLNGAPPPTGVAPTEPPRPVSPEPPLQAAIDAQLEALNQGGIAYVVPREMKVGVETTVFVRISRKFQPADLAEGAQAPVAIKRITVGPVMATELTGRDFDIDPPGRQEQVVGPTGFSEWRWSVIPTDSGQHKLRFVVYVVLVLPDGAEKSFQMVEDRTIPVRINPPYQMWRAVTTNWEMISGVLGILFGGGLVWNLLSRRRERQAKP